MPYQEEWTSLTIIETFIWKQCSPKTVTTNNYSILCSKKLRITDRIHRSQREARNDPNGNLTITRPASGSRNQANGTAWSVMGPSRYTAIHSQFYKEHHFT